jgi:hypothetical protein
VYWSPENVGYFKKTKCKALILKKIISCFHCQKLYGMRVFPNDKAQSHREKAIELEATIRELTGQNGKLELDLVEKAARCSELSKVLDEEKVHASSIERDFQAYKQEHKISGDLGALQSAVAALQAKLEQRQYE